MNSQVTQQFLEESQYNLQEILQDEQIFGTNFYMIGGSAEVVEMLDRIEPIAPRRILDIGSGLGGPAFLMARRYNAHVDGVDISPAMHLLSRQRLEREGLGNLVRFFLSDILEFASDARYDLIFGSNVFLHIHDKDALLRLTQDLLEPGGTFLFGDYCVRVDGPEMEQYIAKFRYDILRKEEWTKRLSAAGFERVEALDCTDRPAAQCERALRHGSISEEWQGILEKRLERIALRQHRWCIFSGRR